MGLKWFGRQVSERVRQAQIVGVNATMAACAVHAKRNHAWRNRSATLEGSIDIQDYARPDDRGVRGLWGSRDVRYARIHELGGVIRPVRAKALAIPQPDGTVRFVRQVTIPARPYLRPAADVEYPRLAARIRRAYEGGDR